MDYAHPKCKQVVNTHPYLYPYVSLAVELYLGKLFIVLSDSVERQLRLASVTRLGGKKGDLSSAIEEAIKDWLKKDWNSKHRT